MRTSAINSLSAYVPPVFRTTVSATGTAGNNLTGVTTPTVQAQPDSTQLSPLARLLSQLQQLQQNNPTQYQQLTQQIATNLQSAAQTAQSEGNTSAANQLNQLATDFSNASQTGQLPDIQNLAQAVGGGHHHHHQHHSHASSGDSNGDTSGSTTSDASSGSSTTSSLDASLLTNQYLAGIQASGTQSDSQNPLGIILNTLSSAGVSVSSS